MVLPTQWRKTQQDQQQERKEAAGDEKGPAVRKYQHLAEKLTSPVPTEDELEGSQTSSHRSGHPNLTQPTAYRYSDFTWQAREDILFVTTITMLAFGLVLVILSVYTLWRFIPDIKSDLRASDFPEGICTVTEATPQSTYCCAKESCECAECDIYIPMTCAQLATSYSLKRNVTEDIFPNPAFPGLRCCGDPKGSYTCGKSLTTQQCYSRCYRCWVADFQCLFVPADGSSAPQSVSSTLQAHDYEGAARLASQRGVNSTHKCWLDTNSGKVLFSTHTHTWSIVLCVVAVLYLTFVLVFACLVAACPKLRHLLAHPSEVCAPGSVCARFLCMCLCCRKHAESQEKAQPEPISPTVSASQLSGMLASGCSFWSGVSLSKQSRTTDSATSSASGCKSSSRSPRKKDQGLTREQLLAKDRDDEMHPL